MDVHTLLCFCRQKRLTSKFRTFALRLGRRATEAKFSKAIANRKNQRRRQRQNPNGIAELNSTRARAPCSVLRAGCSLSWKSPPKTFSTRGQRARERNLAAEFKNLGMLIPNTASLYTFFRHFAWRASSIRFCFILFSLFDCLFTLRLDLFTIRGSGGKPWSRSFLTGG